MTFKPLVPGAPCLYPLKTSEKPKVFWCFHGVDKGYIGNKSVNQYVKHGKYISYRDEPKMVKFTRQI